MAKVFSEESNPTTKAALPRRLVAMLYDTLICAALMLATTGIYMAISSSIVGAENYEKMVEAGATTNDPLLSSILFIMLY